MRLPKGVIVNGKVKNPDQLVNSLKQLKKKLKDGKQFLNVIVSIPSSNVYMQVFNLPTVPKNRLNEVAGLNLKLISPINVRSAYYDWQTLSGNQYLGAFISAEIIDKLSQSLEKAGFNIAAIEPAPLSLARVLEKKLLDAGDPHIGIYFSGSGLEFFVLRKGQIYFNYFSPETKNIELVISQELQRLSGFYIGKWGEPVKHLVVSGITLTQNFGMEVHVVNVNPAQGAALRGLIPRADDHLISLAQADTEEKFFRGRVSAFLQLWRSITISALIFMALVYLLVDISLWVYGVSLNKRLLSAPVDNGLDAQMIKELKQQAREFNLLVNKAVKAKKESVSWSPFLKILYSLIGNEVKLRQVQLEPRTLTVIIKGIAQDEQAVLALKNKLAREDNFTEINLPLTSIQISPEGKADFSLTFKIRHWPF